MKKTTVKTFDVRFFDISALNRVGCWFGFEEGLVKALSAS